MKQNRLSKKMKKLPVDKTRLRQIWNKYALIVVGNIVFFLLLYFISYRPQNADNRASEFLNMAQTAQSKGFNEAAMVLYRKVIEDYPQTRANDLAVDLLASLKNNLKETPVAEPVCDTSCDEIDIEEMLRKGPPLYLATYLANHYNAVPADRAKLRELIFRYLGVALNTEGISLAALRTETEFQNEIFAAEFFQIRPICIFESDWLYDNFSVTNGNFYSWHNANLVMTVSQGDQTVSKTLRVEKLEPDETVDLLEFRVKKGGGVVSCQVEVTSQQGRITRVQEM